MRISNVLRAAHVPAPARAKNGWTKSAVREMLYNERYLGKIVFGKTRRRKLSDGSSARDTTPESEWTTIQRDDLRIIDDETWAAAHARLKTTHEAYLTRSNGTLVSKPELVSKRLLAGFLVCGTCRSPMVVDRRSFGGKFHPAYICGQRRIRGIDSCSNSHALRATLIEEVIVRDLREFLSPERLAATLGEMAEHTGGQAKLEADRASIKAAIDKVNQEISNLTAALAEMHGSRAVQEGIRDRELRRHDLESELRRLDAVAEATANKGKLLAELQEQFGDWYELLSAAPANVAVARQWLRKLLAGPIYCHPHFDDEVRCWRYAGMGTLDGLIRGAVGRMTYKFAERWKIEPPETDRTASST